MSKTRLPAGYGSFTQVAFYLGGIDGSQITRQQVFAWYSRRERNGFPEPITITRSTGTTLRAFRLQETAEWLRNYRNGSHWPDDSPESHQGVPDGTSAARGTMVA